MERTAMYSNEELLNLLLQSPKPNFNIYAADPTQSAAFLLHSAIHHFLACPP